ncbi:MAG: alpha/beta hydrolase [Rubrivivax sp.]|jgi:S-formylglutathione hydrolase FrmB
MTRFRTFECSRAELTPEGLQFITVKSPALGRRADVLLFMPRQALGAPTPPEGSSRPAPQPLPLVILLHGVYGSHWSWAFQGAAHHTAQRLIDAGTLPPMALAMPSDGLWGDGSGYVAHHPVGESSAGETHDVERWIVEEVPALCSQAQPALGAAAPLFIAGLSMGGFGALRLAGKYPQRFAAAAGHSTVTEAAQLDALMAEARTTWSAAPADQSVLQALRSAGPALPPLRFDCGRDDPFLQANRHLHHSLLAAGIAHTYEEHEGGHGWDYWTRHLEDTLRFFAAVLAAAEHRGQS